MKALEIAEQVCEADSKWLAEFRELVQRIKSPESDIAVGESLDEDEAFEDAVETQE